VRLVIQHKVESGSVASRVRPSGAGSGSVRRPCGGGVAKLRSMQGEREGVTGEELAEIKRLKAENPRCGRIWKFSTRRQLSSRQFDAWRARLGSLVSLLPLLGCLVLVACPRCAAPPSIRGVACVA